MPARKRLFRTVRKWVFRTVPPHRPPTPARRRALNVAIKVLVRTNRFEIDQADFVIDGVAQQVKLVGAAEFLEE